MEAVKQDSLIALYVLYRIVDDRLIGLAPSKHHIDAALFLAPQAGYYGYWERKKSL